jgi:hypothetical protein
MSAGGTVAEQIPHYRPSAEPPEEPEELLPDGSPRTIRVVFDHSDQIALNIGRRF